MRPSHRHVLIAPAWLVALPISVSAQTGLQPDPPPIIVTGRGLDPTPATPAYDSIVLDSGALTATASGRIEDALAGVAGFQQFRRSDSRSANPSAQGATLRSLGGNASSRALVLLDGVPLADPFFGFIPFSAVAPERLASARVTRGGGSGPFGAGALAGAIELTSADAQSLGPASGQLLANHRGETEASASFAPQLGAGYAMLSGRWDRGRGFYTTPQDQRVPASVRARYESWSVEARAAAPLSGAIELQARMLAYDDQRTLRFAGADSTTSGQDASLRLVGRGRWQFDALAYVQARDFTNVVVSATRFVPVLDQRATPSTGIGGKLELRPPVGGGHSLRVGIDYRRAQGRALENALSPVTGTVTARRAAGGINTDLGLFIEDDWQRGALTLTAGLRADRFGIANGFRHELDPAGRRVGETLYPDRSGWIGSLRGGALLSLGEGVTLRAAAYTGLRLPTLNELYRPFTVFPVTTLANPGLRSERLRGYEAGVEARPGRNLRLSLTAFDNAVADAIANVSLGPNLRQRQNIDRIRARGIEARAALEAGALALDASLAYSDSRARGSGAATALDGRRPAQTPRWFAGGTLRYTAARGLTAALTLRHVGTQFEDDLESDRLPAFATLDAYVRVPLTPVLALVLRGENLADTRIVTRNQAGSIDLGPPRTLWAGLKWGL